MEIQCYKCGAALEEGIPFCEHCRAPQIRVISSEPEHSSPSPQIFSPAHQSDRIDWPVAFRAASIAGSIGAFLMLTPLGLLGLGMVTSGLLTIIIYRSRAPEFGLSVGAGTRLGALSGLIGSAVFAVLATVGVAVFHLSAMLREKMLESIQQAAARSSDPQAQQAVEFFKTPQGLVTSLIVAAIFMFVAFIVLSAAGGAVGALLMRKKDSA
ncbi:MAG: hypothetical protein DMG91_10880 [Acidobacteria bacterium]|jgi:hypothetical protein|nr:MAG: hypothetical protein DMG91_10880 [Acidobacteriota bacterium]